MSRAFPSAARRPGRWSARRSAHRPYRRPSRRPAPLAPRRTARVIVLALAGLLAACSGPSRPAPPEQVLVIVLDATAAAHISSYGGPAGLTPHLDALAARGVRFARAVSNTTWTLPSTVSLMTGLLQENHGVVTNRHRVPEGMPLLAERMRASGRRTAAFVQMVYASDRYGLDRGFGDYRYYGTARAERVEMLGHVLEWIDAHADEPWFLYVHFRRPHSPYDPTPVALAPLEGDCTLADGRADHSLARADALPPGTELDAAERAHVRHLYRANLATVDARVGEILRRAADALVLVTSDHGEALGEHGAWGHGRWLHAECVDIPLIVAAPGLAPRVDEEPACTVDVAPTLVDWLGLAPLESDGSSLLPRLLGDAEPTPRSIHLSARYNTQGPVPRRGVIVGDEKLVVDAEGTVALFDRRTDPTERDDLAQARAERRAALLRRVRPAWTPAAPEAPAELDDAARRDLEELGYLR